jgi:hypothetical protein
MDRFYVVEVGLVKSKAKVEDESGTYTKEDLKSFSVGLDICNTLKAGNIFLINPFVTSNDDDVTFGLGIGYMFTVI